MNIDVVFFSTSQVVALRQLPAQQQPLHPLHHVSHRRLCEQREQHDLQGRGFLWLFFEPKFMKEECFWASVQVGQVKAGFAWA